MAPTQNHLQVLITKEILCTFMNIVKLLVIVLKDALSCMVILLLSSIKIFFGCVQDDEPKSDKEDLGITTTQLHNLLNYI